MKINKVLAFLGVLVIAVGCYLLTYRIKIPTMWSQNDGSVTMYKWVRPNLVFGSVTILMGFIVIVVAYFIQNKGVK